MAKLTFKVFFVSSMFGCLVTQTAMAVGPARFEGGPVLAGARLVAVNQIDQLLKDRPNFLTTTNSQVEAAKQAFMKNLSFILSASQQSILKSYINSINPNSAVMRQLFWSTPATSRLVHLG